jgi:hypothetical protein
MVERLAQTDKTTANTTKTKKDKPKKQARQLYSLKTFLATAPTMPKYHNVSKVQYAGFRATMIKQDRQYVFDPQDYVKSLDAYLGK